MTVTALLSRLMNSRNRCLNNGGVLSRRNGNTFKLKLSAVNKFGNNPLMDSCLGKDDRIMMDASGTVRVNSTSTAITTTSPCEYHGSSVIDHCADSELEYYNPETEVISLVKDTDSSNIERPLVARGTRKRPSPFGSQGSATPAKWIGLESPTGPGDVIVMTYDLEDMRAEQSSVEDEANGIVYQDMCNGKLETPPHGVIPLQYLEPPFSSLVGAISCQTVTSFNNDVFDPEISSWNASSEIQRESYCCNGVGNEQTTDVPSTNPSSQQLSKHSRKMCKGLKTKERLERRRALDNFKMDTSINHDSVHVPEFSVKRTHIVRSVQTCPRNVKTWSKHWGKLVQAVDGFILVLNSDLTVTFVSKNVIDHLGFHHNGMIDQPLSSFLHSSHLPVMDYIKNKGLCHKGVRPLERCHPIPIQLRHGQHKNSGCYRAFNWHAGVMRSGRPGTTTTYCAPNGGSVVEDGGCGGDNGSVIISVCIPVSSSLSSSTSSSSSSSSTTTSLMPSRLEWVLRPPRPRHWTFCYSTADNKWAFYPQDIDPRRIGFKMTPVPDAVTGLSSCKSPCERDCPMFKTSQLEDVITVLWNSCPDIGLLVKRGHDDTCARWKCGRRWKNTEDITDWSKDNTFLIQPLESVNNNNANGHSNNNGNGHSNNNYHPRSPLQKTRFQLRKTPRHDAHRNTFEWTVVCLQRKSPKSCCARRWTKDKRVVNTDDEETAIKFSSTSTCKNARESDSSIHENRNSESLVIYTTDNHFISEENSSNLRGILSNQSKENSFHEKAENENNGALKLRSSDECRNVNAQLSNSHETNNRDTSNPCQPSPQPNRTSQQTAGLEDGGGLSAICDPTQSCERDDGQNDTSSNVSEGFSVVGLEEIDLTTEFSFHERTGDVVMPVESELDCVGEDIGLNNSPINNIEMSYAGLNVSDQCVEDPFSPQASSDFTYSLDSDFQTDGFQTFDHILDFPPSNITPSSNGLPSHISVSSSSSNLSSDLNYNDCSNELLMEMDDVVPENKNPFEKGPQSFRHSLSSLLQSCDNPLKQPHPNSITHNENRKSLLRSLLNVNEERASALSNPRQHSKFSRRFSGSESYLKLKHITQTKELPVPQSQSYKKRRLTTPMATQELPLPGSVLKNAFNSVLSPTVPPKTFDMCRTGLTNLLHGDEFLPNLTHQGNGFPTPQTSPTVDYDNSNSMDFMSDHSGDALPDDLVDLAMEYCNSLDNEQTENLIGELSEQFGWLENTDPVNGISSSDGLNQTSYSSEIGSALQVLNANSQYPQFGTGNSYRSTTVQVPSTASACLPLSTPITAKTNKESPSVSALSNSLSPHSNGVNKTDHISLLRQAVTSPNVDKLIEKIPLSRKLLYEKSRSVDQNPSPKIDKKHMKCHVDLVDKSTQNTLNFLNSGHSRPSDERHIVNQLNQSRKCISNFNASYRSEKTPAAVSHISISAPPLHSPKKTSFSRSHVSPIKLKIPAPNEITNRRRSQATKIGSTICSPKSSSCPNSSSEGVSVMVMRKENHRSRKNKTVATQTEHHPDEVYPALEMSPSDVILTPSVYCDTSLSSHQTSPPLQSVKSPQITSPGNKTASHSCNIFSSSIRSLASPRDSKEMSATTPSPSPSQASPSPSASSTSSLSELELHLRGWSGPDSNLSSPLSSETSETSSSEVPFLQRFLTGELSKDKYEKLDKGLLEKQKSNSTCSASRF